MSPEEDMNEFWRLLKNAPVSIPHRDTDEYHMDLLCRAGKEVIENRILKEAIEFLLCHHPMSGFLRPLVMTITRAIDRRVWEIVNVKKNSSTK